MRCASGTRPPVLVARVRRLALVDTALRALAGSARQRRQPLPGIGRVSVAEDRVVVHLVGAATRPPAPWVVEAGARSWSVQRRDLATAVAGEPAPWPLLVAVETGPGHDVFVDLSSAPGLVAVGGDSTLACPVTLSLVLDLMTHPWSSTVQVLLVGFGARPTGSGAGRARWTDDLDALLDGYADRPPRSSVLVELGVDGVLHGSRPGSTTRPHVVVLAAPPGPGHATRIAQLTSERARCSFLCVGESTAARWRFVVDAWGQLQFPAAGIGGPGRKAGRQLSSGEFRNTRRTPWPT